jgi:hypothetical protein
MNESVTWDDIAAHPTLPWCWNGISLNPNITLYIIANHMDKDWSWELLSGKK